MADTCGEPTGSFLGAAAMFAHVSQSPLSLRLSEGAKGEQVRVLLFWPLAGRGSVFFKPTSWLVQGYVARLLLLSCHMRRRSLSLPPHSVTKSSDWKHSFCPVTPWWAESRGPRERAHLLPEGRTNMRWNSLGGSPETVWYSSDFVQHLKQHQNAIHDQCAEQEV